MMTRDELIAELLKLSPNDCVIGVYVESIDSVVDVTGVEMYNGEINIRVDY
jgi:hypothetical protein